MTSDEDGTTAVDHAADEETLESGADEGAPASGADEGAPASGADEGAPASGADATATAAEDATDRLDAAAETFLAVEDRLRPGEAPWRAIRVEVVDADVVPADYPRAIETVEALELVLEPPGGEATEAVYLPFPDDGVVSPDSDLGRLLDRLSIPADRFGDLHGEAIPVAKTDGALVVDLAAEGTARGSDRAILGLLGGYGLLLAAAVVALAGGDWLVGSPLGLAALAVLHVVVLPLSTYLDGWHLRETTRWDHAPGLWAILAVLPGVNLVTTALYLLSRNAATAGR